MSTPSSGGTKDPHTMVPQDISNAATVPSAAVSPQDMPSPPPRTGHPYLFLQQWPQAGLIWTPSPQRWDDHNIAGNSIMRTLVQNSYLWKKITSGMLLLSVGPLRSERCCFLGCSKPLQTWKPENRLCFYIVEKVNSDTKQKTGYSMRSNLICMGGNTYTSAQLLYN